MIPDAPPAKPRLGAERLAGLCPCCPGCGLRLGTIWNCPNRAPQAGSYAAVRLLTCHSQLLPGTLVERDALAASQPVFQFPKLG